MEPFDDKNGICVDLYDTVTDFLLFFPLEEKSTILEIKLAAPTAIITAPVVALPSL